MKVLLINGSMDANNSNLENYFNAFAKERKQMGDDVKQTSLYNKEIKDCIGCYSCWLKTPGVCIFKDDEADLLKDFVWADQVIWFSPVRMGFVTSILKRANDRMIPLIHPFLRLNGDRMAHLPRYEKTAKHGLLLEHTDDLDNETVDIIASMYGRYDFVKTTEKTPKEVAHETYSI